VPSEAPLSTQSLVDALERLGRDLADPKGLGAPAPEGDAARVAFERLRLAERAFDRLSGAELTDALTLRLARAVARFDWGAWERRLAADADSDAAERLAGLAVKFAERQIRAEGTHARLRRLRAENCLEDSQLDGTERRIVGEGKRTRGARLSAAHSVLGGLDGERWAGRGIDAARETGEGKMSELGRMHHARALFASRGGWRSETAIRLAAKAAGLDALARAAERCLSGPPDGSRLGLWSKACRVCWPTGAPDVDQSLLRLACASASWQEAGAARAALASLLAKSGGDCQGLPETQRRAREMWAAAGPRERAFERDPAFWAQAARALAGDMPIAPDGEAKRAETLRWMFETSQGLGADLWALAMGAARPQAGDWPRESERLSVDVEAGVLALWARSWTARADQPDAFGPQGALGAQIERALRLSGADDRQVAHAMLSAAVALLNFAEATGAQKRQTSRHRMDALTLRGLELGGHAGLRGAKGRPLLASLVRFGCHAGAAAALRAGADPAASGDDGLSAFDLARERIEAARDLGEDEAEEPKSMLALLEGHAIARTLAAPRAEKARPGPRL
jgi:hypothetical protein